MTSCAISRAVLLCAALSAALAGNAAGEGHKPFHKILVDQDGSMPDLLQRSGRLVADYGSFQVLEVTSEDIAALGSAEREALDLRDDMDRLMLRKGSFDTQLAPELPGIPPELRERPDAAGPRLVLIQFAGPVQDPWLEAVRRTGARTVHAIPVDGMLLWAAPEAVAQLRKLAAGRGFVQYVGPYHPGYKLASNLFKRVRGSLGKSSSQILTLSVQRYAAGSDAVERLADEVLVPAWPVLDYENLRIRIRLDRLPELLHQPDVVRVREWTEPVLFDEVQDQILAARFDADRSAPAAPGYLAWLLSLGLSTASASYPVLTVVDDGIGNGTVNTGDPTLHAEGSLANPTRMKFNEDCTGDGAHGRDGHGHINASIAGGYDARAGNPFQDAGGYARGLGVNPFGRISGLRIFNDIGTYDIARCGNSDAGVIDRSYRLGTRISSNSWGAPVQGDYEDSAQAYDAGTRDALRQTAGNQQMLFVFAAGNQGPGSSSIGSPATAKNVVTVGASENFRPDGTDGCNVSASSADDASDIVGFSSRGPAEGNRVKPEVVAPGSHIQGTASTSPQFTGNSVCDQYWPAGQTVFARSSGTSHSTPAVSGALSLYHHWLRTHHLSAVPSPALLKAYLVAHTGYLTGSGAGDTLPSTNQGYGIPDLGLAFDGARRFLVDQSQRFDRSGDLFSLEGSVDDPDRPFKAVLVWTDAPGSLAGAPQVNDLDLEVIADGVTYRGNRFSGQWSIPGGAADPANNTEAVALPPGAASALEIRVLARNIAGDGVPGAGDATDQDFALVVYNVSDDPAFRLSLGQSSASLCKSGALDIPVDIGQIKGFASPVSLAAEGLPAGASATFAPPSVTPPGSSMMTLIVPEGTPFDRHQLRVVAASGALVRAQDFSFTVDHPLHEPLLRSPPDAALSVSPTAPLSWYPVPGNSAYRLQVGADPGFGAPLIDRLEESVSLRTEPLESAKLHYWRVQSTNGCGGSTFSEVRSFETATISSLSAACPSLPLVLVDNDPNGVVCGLAAPAGFVIQDLTLDIQIQHTYRGDLLLELTSPRGTKLRLKNPDIDDDVEDLSGNYDRTLAPAGPGDMSIFDGEEVGGTWNLLVSDNFGQDVGQVEAVQLNLSGFVPEAGPRVPIAGWLGGSLATLLAGWLCQRSARRIRPRSSRPMERVAGNP